MTFFPLQWRHNGCDSVSNHQPHECLLNRLFRRRLKKASKLRVTGLCAGNSPVPGQFPAQMASNAENVSIWWRHHVIKLSYVIDWTKIRNKHLLPHWGRVTHICVGNITTIIGSENGLSPRIYLIGPLGRDVSEILIESITFLLKKMHLKVSSAKRRPYCLGLNVSSLASVWCLIHKNATYPNNRTISPSHKAPVSYPTMHNFATKISARAHFCNNDALWDMGLVHFGICATSLLCTLLVNFVFCCEMVLLGLQILRNKK